MENRITKSEKVCMGLCIVVLCFLTFTILTRFLSRQILIEKLHWDNAFTRLVWFDNTEAGGFGSNEEGAEFSVDIDWEKIYPFENYEKNNITESGKETSIVSRINRKVRGVSELIYGIEEKISQYTDNLLIGYNKEVQIAKSFNSFLGVNRLPGNANNSEILYLDNGYLTYFEPLVSQVDINEIADNVADFANYLNDREIEFLYVNAGSKVCPYDRQTIYVDMENTNENGDALLNALSERGISCFDMREKMIEDGLDWYDSYYITDHHWKTETGLWAAKKLATCLNDEFEYDFDISKFEPEAYNMVTTENFWLGGQGRTVTFANADLESYTKIIPMFDTDFHIEVPSRNVSKDGRYAEVLFDNDVYDAVSEYSEYDYLNKSDAYHSVTWKNDPVGSIRNKGDYSNEGKKILFLQDSFSWYLSTFIACDIEAVDLMHPGVFTGSIRRYIEETRPDMVIMTLCERNIVPIGKPNHTDIFELR